MSLVWQHRGGEKVYRVTRAGHSIRLYTNGVFHSQWNTKRPFSGHLWDLLTLPLFFQSDFARKTLLLGVGGGAAIKAFHHFSPKTIIDAIDLDSIHLDVAEEYFACGSENVNYHHEDATDYVKNCRYRYDIIIDDLFFEDHGQALRAVDADETWFAKIKKRLSARGILVVNFEDSEQFRKYAKSAVLKRQGFVSCFKASSARYENAIGVFSGKKIRLSDLQKNLATHLGDAQAGNVLGAFYFNKHF